MPRFARIFAVLSVVAVSAPAFACRRGVAVQVGNVYMSVGKYRHRPCVEVIGAAPVQPLPPVAYYTQAPVVVAPPPPPVYVQPAPQVYVQPAPQVVVQPPPPPVVYSNPPMVYAQPAPAPVVVQKAAPVEDNRPGFLAIKYMPGVSSTVALSNGEMSFGGPGFAHSPGLELRLTRWLSLRSDLEFRKEGRTWDMLGVKLSLLPNSPLKPYASVAFSGNENYTNPGKYSFGFAGAAGLDLMLGKHFFIEAEARYRMTPGACCSDVPVVAGVIGGGVAFF